MVRQRLVDEGLHLAVAEDTHAQRVDRKEERLQLRQALPLSDYHFCRACKEVSVVRSDEFLYLHAAVGACVALVHDLPHKLAPLLWCMVWQYLANHLLNLNVLQLPRTVFVHNAEGRFQPKQLLEHRLLKILSSDPAGRVPVPPVLPQEQRLVLLDHAGLKGFECGLQQCVQLIRLYVAHLILIHLAERVLELSLELDAELLLGLLQLPQLVGGCLQAFLGLADVARAAFRNVFGDLGH
mmetsp:Transcript_121299/g.210853  ORF Transcript_121299/g.210853 Transcript_121299/m.210853 type:complete len:239 (+) Transcript_121299:2061-2777(+)